MPLCPWRSPAFPVAQAPSLSLFYAPFAPSRRLPPPSSTTSPSCTGCPLVLMSTSPHCPSKSSLGKGMSDEEKRSLKQELRALKMEDVSLFMESLPPDFITVLHTELGAPQRIRHLTYAKVASYGLHSQLRAPSDSAVQFVISNLEGCLDYFRLRFILELVELVLRLEQTRHSVISWLRKHILFIPQFPGRTAVLEPETDS